MSEESRRGAVFVFGRDTAVASHDCCCATSNTMSTFGTRVLVSLTQLPKSTVFFHFVASRASPSVGSSRVNNLNAAVMDGQEQLLRNSVSKVRLCFKVLEGSANSKSKSSEAPCAFDHCERVDHGKLHRVLRPRVDENARSEDCNGDSVHSEVHKRLELGPNVGSESFNTDISLHNQTC